MVRFDQNGPVIKAPSADAMRFRTDSGCQR